MKINCKKLITIVDGEKINFNDEIIITGITTDSREMNTKDNLFIPLKGDQFDGHNYIENAFKKGCELTLTSKDDIKQPAILVKDTKKAMMAIAEYYRKLINPQVIAIVGSVGKTTTKELIYDVLSQDYNVLKTHMNFNNEIGVPLTIFKLNEKHEILILELGMNHFGEMRNLSKMSRPDYLVITNIGSSHLGNFKNINEILMAKMEVLDYFNTFGTVILNNDDILLKKYFKDKKYKLIKYGFNADSNYKAIENSTKGINGVELKIKSPNGFYNLSLSAVGNHLIYNVLPAVTIGELMDVDQQKIIQGIERYQDVSKRMEIKKYDNNIVINDSYNASFESMKSAIETLEQSDCEGNKIAILGEILELGEKSIEVHRQLGEEISQKNIDLVICIGGNTKYIYESVKKEDFIHTVFFENKDEFIKKYKNYIKENDLVLLKGSRSTKMEDLLELFN